MTSAARSFLSTTGSRCFVGSFGGIAFVAGFVLVLEFVREDFVAFEADLVVSWDRNPKRSRTCANVVVVHCDASNAARTAATLSEEELMLEHRACFTAQAVSKLMGEGLGTFWTK